MRLVPYACLLALLASPSLRADAAPEPGRKWLSAELAFVGLDACPQHRFVLLECSGPGEPQGVPVREGVPQPKLSYRWFRPTLVAVEGELPSTDGDALGRLAERLTSLPHAEELSLGPGEASSWSSATRVRVTYRVLGIEGGAIQLEQVSAVALDAEGNPAELEPASPVLLGVLGGVGVVLLGLVVAFARRGRSPSADADSAGS